jgi:uncharacterized protein YbdZ (MbtH family)
MESNCRIDVNHEGEYSVSGTDMHRPGGSQAADVVGSKEEHRTSIETAWSDMWPLSFKSRKPSDA